MAPLVVERLLAAMNAHDIEAFAGCFHDDYDSRQPAHPDRAFRGREQARRDGSQPEMAGVILAGVRDGRVSWARLYVEPVEQAGAGIEAAARAMSAD